MHDIAASFDQTIYDIFRRKLGLDQQIAEHEHQNQNSNIAMRDLIGTPISLGGDGLTRTLTTVETCFIGGVACAAAIPTNINALANYAGNEQPIETVLTKSINKALKHINEQCQLQSSSHLGSSSRAHTHLIHTSNVQRSAQQQASRKLVRLPSNATQLFRLMSGANHKPGSRAGTRLSANIRARMILAIKQQRKVQEYRMEERTRARLFAIRARGATRFMAPQKQQSMNRISDQTYQSHFCIRHGISFTLGFVDHCFACGALTTADSNHELGCVQAFGDAVSARHNLIRDEIANTMKAIGGVVMIEPTPFPLSAQRTDARWLIGDRDIHIDVSVINPLNSTVCKIASKRQLNAAASRERTKRSTYQSLCETIDAEFVPIVIESYGGYGKEFITFLARMQEIAKDNLTLTDGKILIQEMLDRIAHHIVNLNSRIMKWSSIQVLDQ
jgi:hypothetical protein